MCYLCNEEGYKKYNCPKFNHFEYLFKINLVYYKIYYLLK